MENFLHLSKETALNCDKVVLYHLSRDVRKPVFRVSDQVRHNPGCAATENG